MHDTRKRLTALAAALVMATGGTVMLARTADAQPGRGHGHGKDCPDYHNGEGHGLKKGQPNHEDCEETTTTTAPETTTTVPEVTTTTEPPTVVVVPTPPADTNITVNSETVVEGRNLAPAGTAAGPPAVVRVDRVGMTG